MSFKGAEMLFRCDGLADHDYGCHICHRHFTSGTASFAERVRRELESISYNWSSATSRERIIAGFLLVDCFDGLNYRIVPTTYSGNGTGGRS